MTTLYSVTTATTGRSAQHVNRFFQIDRDKTASAARSWTNFAPPKRSGDLCLAVCFHPSSMLSQDTSVRCIQNTPTVDRLMTVQPGRFYTVYIYKAGRTRQLLRLSDTVKQKSQTILTFPPKYCVTPFWLRGAKHFSNDSVSQNSQWVLVLSRCRNVKNCRSPRSAYKQYCTRSTVYCSGFAASVPTILPVRKVWAYFAVCDCMMTLLQNKILCNLRFSQIDGNGRKFSHIELSNSVISYIF